ncbi:MAG: pantetheine-phosphate adenylyltransferase [Clostridia bacterium]|nr:pantetheine-phosphate adenylyltransferase [Clostridia bacterium]MBR6620820.1 pantetheine-phosphate adenylyltransferase [Clostridia bacterium]
MRIAICPGSFDPITNGHLEIIRRASKLFDKVIVVVMSNYYKKTGAFAPDERVELIKRVTADIPGIEVEAHYGLLADYAAEKNASAIVKGLRAVSDFDTEFQQALANKKLNSEVETVFLTASGENMYLSSSMVKQICEFGGDISEFVPAEIRDDIEKRLRKD